jgi:hypothetical protein
MTGNRRQDFIENRLGKFIRLEAICQAVRRECPERGNTSFREIFRAGSLNISKVAACRKAHQL